MNFSSTAPAPFGSIRCLTHVVLERDSQDFQIQHPGMAERRPVRSSRPPSPVPIERLKARMRLHRFFATRGSDTSYLVERGFLPSRTLSYTKAWPIEHGNPSSGPCVTRVIQMCCGEAEAQLWGQDMPCPMTPKCNVLSN